MSLHEVNTLAHVDAIPDDVIEDQTLDVELDQEVSLVAEVEVFEEPSSPTVPLDVDDEFEESATFEKRLHLEKYEPGTINRAWLKIHEDSIGRPISVPLIVVKGSSPGAVLGITAALHGNELNGLPCIHQLVKRINPENLRGTIVAVLIANVPGYLRNQREYMDGVDLNRVMPGKKNGSSSQSYSHHLIQRLIKHFDFLLDLHTASDGRVNSLYIRADMNDDVTRSMALVFAPQIIVHNTSPDGSLRGAATAMGIKTITIEIGHPSQFHNAFVRYTVGGIIRIMQSEELGMLDQEEELQDGIVEKEQQEEEEENEEEPETHIPVVCSQSHWVFSSVGGIIEVYPKLGQWIHTGSVMARTFTVFGELKHEFLAAEDGVVIGKNVNPSSEQGGRILHLGTVNTQFAERSQDGHE